MRADHGASVLGPSASSHRAEETRGTVLAIDVGGTRTRLALLRDGELTARDDRLTSAIARPGDGVVANLVDAAVALAARAGQDGVAAVGVSLAAATDLEGSVLQEREFGIPAGPGIRDSLAGALGVPVAVDNDANLAALAEATLGAAADGSVVAVVTIGTNIGCGIVVDGRVLRGAHGAAGEPGLLLVPVRPIPGEAGPTPAGGGSPSVDAGPFGPALVPGPAGYAHLETLVGGGALGGAAVRAGYPRGTHVLTRAAATDPVLAAIADRAVEGWAFLIAQLSVVLDLDVAVLTGAAAADAAHLIDRLASRVRELVPFAPSVRLGTLGPDAELLGAFLLARAVLDERANRDAGAGLAAQSRGGRHEG